MAKFIEVLKTKASPFGFTNEEIEGAVTKFSKLIPNLDDDNATEESLEAPVDAVIDFLQMAQKHSDKTIQKNQASHKEELAKLKAEHEALLKKMEESGKKTDTDNKEMNAMKEQMASMKSVMDGLLEEKKTNARNKQLEDILSDTDEEFRKLTMKQYRRMTFTDDEDFSAFLKEVKEDSKEYAQNLANKGLKNLKRVPGNGGKGLSDAESSFIKKLRKEKGLPEK